MLNTSSRLANRIEHPVLKTVTLNNSSQMSKVSAGLSTSSASNVSWLLPIIVAGLLGGFAIALLAQQSSRSYATSGRSGSQSNLQNLQPENESEKRLKYVHPVNPSFVRFINRMGHFNSCRNSEANCTRPHQGIDIYSNQDKSCPVPVRFPVDGVIQETIRPTNPENTSSGNYIKYLGDDGKSYRFSHLASKGDYPKAKTIPWPQVGDRVEAGTPMGYMGESGYTTVKHLHMEVASLEKAEKDKKNPKLQALLENNITRIEGQVDPLDVEKAGPIANLLREYEIQQPGKKYQY